MLQSPAFQETQILFVEGDDLARGRQHAEQTGDTLRRGMAPFYFDFYQRLLNPPKAKRLEKLAYQAISRLIEDVLVKKLKRQVPLEMTQRIRGISEGSGVSERAFLTTLVLPDLLPMLQAYWLKWKPDLAIDAVAPPRFGCSSFIAKGNRFLMGRNLDFPGVNYWDRFPVIEVVTPQTGFKYMGFSSAGVPVAGISGINEKGLAIALHQHYCLETNLSGQLPFIISERVLNQAENLEQALAILKKSQLASSWAFIVAERKNKNGFVFEATPTRFGVRWLKDEQDVLTHSNYFISSDLKGKDYATTERMNWDNFWRRETLDRTLRANLEDLSLEKAAQWLSGNQDPFWNEEKVVNRTVSQVYNIQSYVIDLEEMKLLLAEGDCPIHLRSYQEYDLIRLFDKKKGKTSKSVPGAPFKRVEVRKAKEKYIHSFVAAFDDQFEKALEDLNTSIHEHPTPEAHLVAALVTLRLGKEKKDALEWLAKGRDLIESKVKAGNQSGYPPEYFEICLYHARVLELMSRKAESKSIYQEMARNPSLRDSNIRKIIAEERSYSERQLRRLVMPYSTYIPFE